MPDIYIVVAAKAVAFVYAQGVLKANVGNKPQGSEVEGLGIVGGGRYLLIPNYFSHDYDNKDIVMRLEDLAKKVDSPTIPDPDPGLEPVHTILVYPDGSLVIDDIPYPQN